MRGDGGASKLLERVRRRVGEDLSMPPRRCEEHYRHELKYLISYGQKADLNLRLAPLLEQDSHARGGCYMIRSLYFDDYWNTAYIDKVNGVDRRKKYRIRLYDLKDDFIRLECKIKNKSYISKISAPLTSAETEKILNGDYDFLLHHSAELCRQFYYECTAKVMRPKVYVDYEREPYGMEEGDVRITFDSDVRGAYPEFGITERDMPFQYVLEPGKLIMEVKFTEFLPKLVRGMLPVRAAELSAVSKYILCCDKINYMSAYDAE